MRRLFPLLFFLAVAFSQPKYSAWLMEKPATIDGDLSEYLDKPFIFLVQGSIPNYLWRGPQDAGAKIWLSWDKDFLYVSGEVLDDILAQNAEPWQESLQIYLAPSLELTYSAIEKKLYTFKDRTFLPESPPFAVKSLNGSYQFEISIPWSLLELTPAEGLSFKFNAVLNDTDISGYRGYIAWSEGWKEGMGIAREGAQFGDVILAAQPAPPYQTAIIFAPTPIFIGDEEMDIPLWLLSSSDVRGRLEFVFKKDSEILLEKDQDIEVKAGFNPLFVHWDGRGKPEGTYIATAKLETAEGVMEVSTQVNKYDLEKEISTLEKEVDRMGKALEEARKVRSWQDAVMVLQGSAWQSHALDFISVLKRKVEETKNPDPDAVILARIFLWESRDYIPTFEASSALIRRDYASPAMLKFPTLRLPSSQELSYLWEFEKWQTGGSFERLTLVYANLPIASISLWTHPDSSLLGGRRDEILARWRENLQIPEEISGNGWQGWATASGEVLAQAGNNLWLAQALSKDVAIYLINSAIASQQIGRIEDLMPPLQPNILVEDISKAIGFNFPEAGFYASKDDKESLALAQSLVQKLGGKLIRLEEVNRYKDVVIVGLPALRQLIGNFKMPAPDKEAYILSRYIWGKNVLILVGKEKGSTTPAVEVLQDMVDYLRDKKMLVGDVQAFTNLSTGKLSPQQIVLTAMGSLSDFIAISDKGTRVGAKQAIWDVSERGWKITVIPGETFSISSGEIVSLGAIESIKASEDVRELVLAIHEAGGMAIGGNVEGVEFDAYLMGKAKMGKPIVAGTYGEYSSPLRTIVFSDCEGIYDILTSIKRGDCIAFSPTEKFGEERLKRLIDILLDERRFLVGRFSERARSKALALSP
ncbi:hypothetical protein H5T88_00395 [bacterium]|nr:hypothetical protein [bacterium]